MKKFQIFTLAIVLLVSSFSFQSCVKDPEVTQATNARTWIVIGLHKRFNSCQPGGAICVRVERLAENALNNLQLALDEATSKPVVLEDGSIQLEAQISVDQLSPAARKQLLSEKVMIVDEDFALSETTMQQAYENSGLAYNGEQAKVAKGVYRILTEGADGTTPQRIKIKITFGKGELHISITW